LLDQHELKMLVLVDELSLFISSYTAQAI